MVTVYSQHAVTASIQLDNLDIQHRETSLHEGAACGGPTNTSMHAHVMVPPTLECIYIAIYQPLQSVMTPAMQTLKLQVNKMSLLLPLTIPACISNLDGYGILNGGACIGGSHSYSCPGIS